MKIVNASTFVLLLVAVAIFCIQNLEAVSISYLGWQFSIPMALLVLVAYLGGMLTGWGALSFLRKSLRHATEKQS